MKPNQGGDLFRAVTTIHERIVARNPKLRRFRAIFAQRLVKADELFGKPKRKTVNETFNYTLGKFPSGWKFTGAGRRSATSAISATAAPSWPAVLAGVGHPAYS